MHVSNATATLDEAEVLRRIVGTRLDLARKAGRLPAQARFDDVELSFGEDTDGEPAVWISIWTNSEPRPSEHDVAKLTELLDDIVADVLKSDARHWPYFRFHAKQPLHGAA